MFGRATITLGIGPHSSVSLFPAATGRIMLLCWRCGQTLKLTAIEETRQYAETLTVSRLVDLCSFCVHSSHFISFLPRDAMLERYMP